MPVDARVRPPRRSELVIYCPMSTIIHHTLAGAERESENR